MPRILNVVNDAKLEAYRYFDKNIRKLPKTSDGSFDETKPGFSNNDVDAFRHAYVSGVITIEYSSMTADILGRLNELVPYFRRIRAKTKLTWTFLTITLVGNMQKNVKAGFACSMLYIKR